MDILAVREATKFAADHARSGKVSIPSLFSHHNLVIMLNYLTVTGSYEWYISIYFKRCFFFCLVRLLILFYLLLLHQLTLSRVAI